MASKAAEEGKESILVSESEELGMECRTAFERHGDDDPREERS